MGRNVSKGFSGYEQADNRKIKSKKMSKCTIGRRLDEFPEKWKK